MPSNASIKQALKLIEDDKSKVLGLTLGNKSITTGEFVPKAGTSPIAINLLTFYSFTDLYCDAEAKSAPEISFAVPSRSATYMVIALDLDAPLPSWGFLGPILHWIQPGLRVSESSDTLTSTDVFVANYIAPAPPPGSSAHRYVFFLYEQPDGFDSKKYAPADGKPLGNMNRMKYDLDAWVKKIGLGQPIAVNYFKSK